MFFSRYKQPSCISATLDGIPVLSVLGPEWLSMPSWGWEALLTGGRAENTEPVITLWLCWKGSVLWAWDSGLLAVCYTYFYVLCSTPTFALSAGQQRALYKSQGPKVPVKSGHRFCMESREPCSPQTLCSSGEWHLEMHMSASGKTYPEGPEFANKY